MKKPKALRRQPRGLLDSKPVFCRLMPDERSTLKDLSEYTGDSVSSVMRKIFLAGVGPYSDKLDAKPRKRTQNGMRAIEQ